MYAIELLPSAAPASATLDPARRRRIGRRIARLAPGPRADAMTLDGNAPALFGASATDLADRFVFAGNRPLVKRVTAHGVERVTDGQHVFRRPFEQTFKLAMAQLLA